MKAIILAAGYATRLYPITIEKPKTLLEIGDKKTLDFIVEKIPKEIRDVSIVVNARFYPLFDEWRKKTEIKVDIINDLTISEENRLGAVRDLYLAVSKTKKDDALVLASDNLFDFGLNDAFELFKKDNHDIIVAYDIKDKNKASHFGVLTTDKQGKIIKFKEKPKQPETSLISTAIYFLKESSLKLLPEYLKNGGNKDGPGNFVSWLAGKRDVYSFVANGRWYDIGDLETYSEAVKDFCNQKILKY